MGLTDERIPLTTAGRRQLEEETARLEEQLDSLRELLIEAHDDRSADEDERAAALGLGDDLGRAEARLAEIRAILAHSTEASMEATDTATVGSLVRLRDADGEELEYTLVTPAEAAPSAGRVSTDAPLGKVLFGRKAGDVITVVAPSGSWDARIVSIGVAA